MTGAELRWVETQIFTHFKSLHHLFCGLLVALGEGLSDYLDFKSNSGVMILKKGLKGLPFQKSFILK